jgi:hypothetical protein
LSDRDDIGSAISNEKPSFERGCPGGGGSTARGKPSGKFSPDPVRLAIGSFVKAGASQAERVSEALGAIFFGRICDLPHDLLGFYEIGSAMARIGLFPPDVRGAGRLAPYTLHDTLFQYLRGKSAIRSIVDQAVTSLKKTRKELPWHRNHRPPAQQLTRRLPKARRAMKRH